MTEPKPLLVFFSWQSDLPDETNRRFIRDALRSAASAIEKEASVPGFRVELDEATRDTPGSPNIPVTIFQKIRSSDVFVADITTINQNREPGTRATPNPNVAVELGYAVAEVGWGRMILLLNDAFGPLQDAPFDLDRHRISSYTCPGLERQVSESNKSFRTRQESFRPKLVEILQQALTLIIKKNPQRPSEADGMSATERRRRRDLEALSTIAGTVHIPTMDHFLEAIAAGKFSHKIFYYWEGFRAVLESSMFHLNDPELQACVQLLHDCWAALFDYDDYFVSGPNKNYETFSAPRDAGGDVWEKLQRSVIATRRAFKAYLGYVRSEYVEIDFSERSGHALDKFVEYHKRRVNSGERDEVPATSWVRAKRKD